MCGIGGIINFEHEAQITTEDWFAFLQHRGPDSQDSWHIENGRYSIGLYHSRLAIRDLGDSGNQPMISSSGRSVMVYNGELYNAECLSNKLFNDIQISFRGTSDTELILEYIEHFGINAFCSDADGMFAIGYFDKQTETMYLLTDDYGQKPIYFLKDEHRFIFSSVYQNIIPFLEKIVFDTEVLYETLNFGINVNRKTSVVGINRVRSREILKIKNGVLSFSDREIVCDSKPLNYDDLSRAIEMTTISDKELGVFRSAGIDSNVVYNSLKAANKPKSFTVSFLEGHDEFNDLIDKSATNRLMITKNHYASFFKDFQIINSDLFIDSSVVALAYLAKFTKKHVDVVLTGDGGDEMFFGYRRHIFLSFIPKALRKGKLIRILYSIILSRYKYNKVLQSPRTVFGDIRDYDLEYFLPKVLTKVDFATMESSLESRAPLLTRHLFKIARSATLTNQKFNIRKGKAFLRRAPSLNNSDLQRRPKRGFTPGLKTAMNELMGTNFILEPELSSFFNNVEIRTSKFKPEQLWGIYYANEWVKRIKSFNEK